jgi:hypothetical protein
MKPSSSIGEIKSRYNIILGMTSEKEYAEMMRDTAIFLWGAEEAEKISSHIETTATAVFRIAHVKLEPVLEPVTRLRHREDL